MTPEHPRRRSRAARIVTIASTFAALAVVGIVSCSKSTSSSGSAVAIVPAPAAVPMTMSTTPPSPDPRIGLRAGTLKRWEKDTTKMVIDQPAAQAIWNLRLLSNTPPSDNFVAVTNSDLAFYGKYAIQGNYNGYQVWDISNPSKPVLTTAYYCPASQSDVSVHRNLLFVSSESPSGRLDCKTDPQQPVSEHRLRGIRIFDASNMKNPKYVANVQNCRGSHTHTIVDDPKDPDNIYIYISGTSGVRPEAELPGCLDLGDDPQSARFRIEVIQVPVKDPSKARIVTGARIFQDLPSAPRNSARSAADSADRANAAAAGGGRGGRGGRGGAAGAAGGGRGGDTSAVGRGGRQGGGAGAVAGGGRGGARGGGGGRAGGAPPGPNQCHDITVYPGIGRAGGACAGLGLLVDITNPANPVRISYVADSNFSFWHSATFSNDGSKILFTDEWGGGSAPKCRASDKYEWGANAIFTIENNQMRFQSYYKMPAAQTALENCVAHNGSLIPIPGRDVMVQGWYQGGISVFDWTDPRKPFEIAFFDRGPLNPERMQSAGSWSAYWYNGVIVSSEIARGLDVLELLPSGFISQNELDAAKTVLFEQLNPQDQPKMVWPASFALARAYVDQLERSRGLSAARISAVRSALMNAERASGGDRRTALTQLATEISGEAASSSDQKKVQMLAGAVTDLAK